MKNLSLLVLLIVLVGVPALAYPPSKDVPLTEQTVKVSEHVRAIMGFPNIGIVIGKDAVLVVDTGLGRANGATVVKVVKRLAPHHRIFLTSTHFHPEHAGGVLGFPADTLLIRNKVQQDELDQHGEEMIRMFGGQNEKWKSWLVGEQLRAPDEVFEKEVMLNLGGGVTVKLLYFGPAHIKGDEVVFVDPDKTLISGDVVQNKVTPHIFGEGGTASSWIADIEQIGKLGALHVLPDHSPIGDGSVVEQQKEFLISLKTQALELKKSGKTADQAGQQMTDEVRKTHSDWDVDDLTSFVKAAYSD